MTETCCILSLDVGSCWHAVPCNTKMLSTCCYVRPPDAITPCQRGPNMLQSFTHGFVCGLVDTQVHAHHGFRLRDACQLFALDSHAWQGNCRSEARVFSSSIRVVVTVPVDSSRICSSSPKSCKSTGQRRKDDDPLQAAGRRGHPDT